MNRPNEIPFCFLALVMGIASGWVHVIAPDPTIVALLALVCSMFLGFTRPRRPWLWAAILSVSIPAADLVMYLRGMALYRGRLEGAFVAGLVSGIIGAYAGYLGRRSLRLLLSKPEHRDNVADGHF